MDKNDIKKRILILRTEINRHRYFYHVLDKQEISEAALDSLKNELYKLEMANPDLITPDSPTQRVGGQPLDKFKKVEHSAPMMSLFDAFSEQDMADWEQRLVKVMNVERPNWEYYAEIKLDGLAMALRYRKGSFILGATRGDGRVGEEVTNNLKTIEAIPLQLRQPSDDEYKNIGLNGKQIVAIKNALAKDLIEVRGEAIMTKSVLAELNKKYKHEGRPLLANPRNGAAGSIRQLDPKLSAERKLDFYAYSLTTDLGLTWHEQELALVKLLGFRILKQNKLCSDMNEVYKMHTGIAKMRDKLPFECDGVVVKVNDLSLWIKMGIVGKGPRYMMAYKFAAEQVTTKIIDVVWQVGRTGALTPTAVLKPVRVGGVTVSHATLHNLDEIRRLGLKIGDTVILERAGDVIPKVVSVLPKLRSGEEKNIVLPKICPNCGGSVIKTAGEVAARCVNKNCYAMNLRQLSHWVGKSALDIDGLGPKIIEQLVKVGLVNDIADFYNLTKEDLIELERFADKSADNLIKALAAKKVIDLARFIYGLGIRHVGEETALLLAQELRIKNHELRINELMNYFKNSKLEDLEKLPDVGPIVAGSIYNWFQDRHNIELLNKLAKAGVTIMKSELRQIERKLEGKILVLTGGLNSLTRDQAKAKIRELGGDVSSSVSKNTDYVVAGSEAGSKLDKAQKLGVKIINEEEFLDLIK